MTWESLMAWRHETDEPQLTRFERDCFFSLRSVHQEIAAKKAEKPKETRG